MPKVYRAKFFSESENQWVKSAFNPTPDHRKAVKVVSKLSADFRLKYQIYHLDEEGKEVPEKIIYVPFKGGVIEEPEGSP